MGTPGGEGGIGWGGLGAANNIALVKTHSIIVIILFGAILIGRKSKKKIFASKLFSV